VNILIARSVIDKIWASFELIETDQMLVANSKMEIHALSTRVLLELYQSCRQKIDDLNETLWGLAQRLVDKGVHPFILVKSFEKACKIAGQRCQEIFEEVNTSLSEDHNFNVVAHNSKTTHTNKKEVAQISTSDLKINIDLKNQDFLKGGSKFIEEKSKFSDKPKKEAVQISAPKNQTANEMRNRGFLFEESNVTFLLMLMNLNISF